MNSEREPALGTPGALSSAHGAPPSDDSEPRRRLFERVWFAVSMLYALLRIALAEQFLVKYGLNIYVFAVIEFLSTPIYAIGVSRTVRGLVDSRRSTAIRWLMVAILGFVAPDAYVVVAARRVPASLYLAVLAWVVLGTILGIRRLRRQIKLSRTAEGTRHPD